MFGIYHRMRFSCALGGADGVFAGICRNGGAMGLGDGLAVEDAAYEGTWR